MSRAHASRLAVLALACTLSVSAQPQSAERLMQAPGPPDIRAIAIEFSYYERGREGWVRARGPTIGGVVAARCTYEYSTGAEAGSWSIAFLDGDTALDTMVGTGLLETGTRRTSRTWYGKILRPGRAELACMTDSDNEVSESNESDNRVTRALDVASRIPATTARTAQRAAPGPRFGRVTPREAALVRGAAPLLDLRFTEWAGVKRADDARAARAIGSVVSAAVGERLAVQCGYRVHMDAPNGETLRIASWQATIERDGTALGSAAGKTDLVSVRGATIPGVAAEHFTPTQAGTHRFRCRLDTAGAIAETDEANNVADFTVTVGARSARTAPPAKPAKPAARGQPLLAFAATKPNTLELVMGPKEVAVYKGQLKTRMKWQAPDSALVDWRWQVSLWPFPGDPAAPPPALLREESVPKNAENVFWIDLGGLQPFRATAKPRNAPMDFHIRIVPVKAGKPAGAPSNAVVAHYKPGPDPAQTAASEAITSESLKKQKLAEMNEQSKVYKVEILSFEPPAFPSRFGCVIVVKNPHYQKLGHPLMSYEEGEEYCPKKDPATQQKSDWDQFVEGLEGYGHAWNGLSWFYDKAKDYVATLFAEVVVPCSMLKKLDEGAVSTCQEIAKEVAGTAISVGLTAAGVPPTIPDLEGMGHLAKGKAVEAAVGYTCDAIESEGGHCTPEMREGLAAAYSKGIDELQKNLKKQAQEPHCGSQEVKEQGHIPLPCFNDYPGTQVKPAPGTVETSPAVRVRVTRTKPDPKFALDCGVEATLAVTNDIADFGKAEASIWPAANAKIPLISGVGGSSVLTLNFGPRQPWNPLGKQGATAEWYQLLSGGTGKLSVHGIGTADAQPPLPPGKVSVGCAAGPGPKTISIPKSFGDKTFPWKMN